ncbi:MAG: hypothetical protein ACLP1X_34125 [Polyangiaceae bacterium]
MRRWLWIAAIALLAPASCADVWGFGDVTLGENCRAGGCDAGSVSNGAAAEAGTDGRGMADGTTGDVSGSSSGGGSASAGDSSEPVMDATVAPVEAAVTDASEPGDASPQSDGGGCTPGTSLCLGRNVETCTANGTRGAPVACTTGVANAQAVCVNSACAFACSAGYTLCDGACVDFATDDNNCGGCGSAHACSAGLSCQSGTCALSQASPACSACLLANCNSQYAAVAADSLAIAVANCGLQNQCVGTCCFCSGGPCTSCTGYGGGPCRAVMETAAGVESPSVCTTDGPTLTTDCQSSSNSCGKANILETCESAMCQSQCMAAACN